MAAWRFEALRGLAGEALCVLTEASGRVGVRHCEGSWMRQCERLADFLVGRVVVLKLGASDVDLGALRCDAWPPRPPWFSMRLCQGPPDRKRHVMRLARARETARRFSCGARCRGASHMPVPVPGSAPAGCSSLQRRCATHISASVIHISAGRALVAQCGGQMLRCGATGAPRRLGGRAGRAPSPQMGGF